MHRRLGHPSKDVLRHAREHVADFPTIEFPKEEPLCRGCAEGKMPLRSFPPSTRRASQPFELIHSDLKSFPVDSYHKYKYAIMFLDDHTSHAWAATTCLHYEPAGLQPPGQLLSAPGAYLWVLDPSYLIWALSGLSLDLPVARPGSAPHVPSSPGWYNPRCNYSMDQAAEGPIGKQEIRAMRPAYPHFRDLRSSSQLFAVPLQQAWTSRPCLQSLPDASTTPNTQQPSGRTCGLV
ncbi:hypothetical protein NUW54_g845 [Trametes sanguinea]|uniref:Uncharacterized protein n=1 Tax=Trametes sanguinea TaxID=158606 RepID=A0ACC1Q9W7_9APHY|nr:hypothetical protein NUW54_g845 [Trametes sanguinea]